MIAVNPEEIRRIALRHGCTFSTARAPDRVKKDGPSQAGQRKAAAKNISKARAWIAKQNGSEFTHPMLSNGTGLNREQAKYVVWKMALEKEIVLLPRGEFENHQTPRRYRKV